jgi:D-3-phosphoglycerate dehydrogenase
VRHYDRVGVLAAVFDRIKEAGINVQETENVVFDGAKAAVARVHLSQAPSTDVLHDIESSTEDILKVTLLPI